MRALTSSVLILQAIVVGLAIPVALVVGGRSAGTAWLLAALALACLLLPTCFGRPGFVAAGWVLQGLVIASGLLVPMMFGLGAVFAALWWTALRLGRAAEPRVAHRAGP
ncbi:MAG: DUF4233 domain-containing protein [Candidatus Nanopelagicales bacterium]